MGANSRFENLRSESGQSVLEFLLVLPLLLTIILLLMRVNTVINMGIVNQKYARAQVFFIAENSPEYPARVGVVSNLANSGMNQLIVGVSESHPADDDGAEGANTMASTYY